MVAPDRPNEVVILDGLVGRPFTISLDTLAHQLRAFNKLLVVSASGATLAEHQRAQAAHAAQPYVLPALGGQYLAVARQAWGRQYQQWGAPIGQPFRVAADGEPRVVLPGVYVHYERVGAQRPRLALLGGRMGRELEAAGILPAGTIQPWIERPLPGAMQSWVVANFGSEAAFSAAFGKTLTDEIWLSQEQMQQLVLRGVVLPQADQPGYVAVLTERAMLAWDGVHGAFMIPLGRMYYAQYQRDAAQAQ
jgi:hypothetical protein